MLVWKIGASHELTNFTNYIVSLSVSSSSSFSLPPPIPLCFSRTLSPLFSGVLCDVLDSPQNGEVVVTGITVGSTASYSCSFGFALVGDEIRTCEDSRRWSGSAPFCRGALTVCLMSNLVYIILLYYYTSEKGQKLTCHNRVCFLGG